MGSEHRLTDPHPASGHIPNWGGGAMGAGIGQTILRLAAEIPMRCDATAFVDSQTRWVTPKE
eukprot:2379337-Pyramimonas_sp.AAC.1